MSHKFLAVSATALILSLAACGKKDEDAKTADVKVESSTSKTAPKVSSSYLKGDSPLASTFKASTKTDVTGESWFLGEDSDFTFSKTEYDAKTGANTVYDMTDGDVRIGRMEMYGVNKNFEADLKKGNEGFVSIAENVRLFDVSMEEDGMMFTVETMELRGLEMSGENVENIDNLTPKEIFAADGGFAFSGFAVQNMAIKGDSDGTEIDMNVEDFRFAGYKEGKIGGMFAKNLKIFQEQTPSARRELMREMPPQMAPVMDMLYPANQTSEIGEFRWDGADISKILPFLTKDETPPMTETDLIKFGGMTFTDMTSFYGDKKVSFAPKTKLDPVKFHWLIPTNIKFTSENQITYLSNMVPDDAAEIQAIFEKNDLTESKGSSVLSWDYNPKSGKAKLFADTKSAGFADYDINLEVSNFNYNDIAKAVEENGDDAMQNFGALDGFSLTIKDEKLIDVIAEIAGLQLGMDGKQTRAMAPLAIGQGKKQVAPISPKLPEIMDTFGTFITDGGSFTLSLAPAKPVSFADMENIADNPPAAIDMLGLSATHTPK